jgi:hypothetical protein
MAVRLAGKVMNINVARNGTTVTLDNDPSIGPQGNIWLIKGDHTNYNALYSLVLAAAANRWTVAIRIEGDLEISPARDAAVRNISVTWT